MKQFFSFTKMHGLGNCYIYVDAISQSPGIEDYGEAARHVSNPSTGIGSDGLIIMEPSEQAEVRMRIFNKDGSEGKNCGNGLRCVARYVYDHGHVQSPSFAIETLAGFVQAEIHVENGEVVAVTIDMGSPVLKRTKVPMAGEEAEQVVNEANTISGEMYRLTAASMGNPHAILFVDDIERAPLTTLGPTLADDHPLFPEGVNVGFVEDLGNEKLAYRVWERGSGITQACGTGACAAVVAACLNGYVKRDREITVHLPGGSLYITWLVDGRVLMKGAASYICSGRYFTA